MWAMPEERIFKDYLKASKVADLLLNCIFMKIVSLIAP